MPNTVNSRDGLKRLKDGNARFTQGVRSVASIATPALLQELADKGQKPYAIVLTCSDSRSPVEMLFDQNLGDVFVVRVAGNVVAPSLLGSMEFAAANFGSSVIVVMGHTKCGAVNATYKHTLAPHIPLPSGNLEELVSRVRPAVEATIAKGKFTSEAEAVEASTIANVERSIKLITEQSQIIRDFVAQGKIEIHGAVLDIATGKVNFLEETAGMKTKISAHANSTAEKTLTA